MNIILEKIIQNKKRIILSVVIIVFIILISILIYKMIDKKINDIDISNAIHGVVVYDNVGFYRKPKESKWKHRRDFELGENVYIVDEFKDDSNIDWYKIKAKDKVGYVLKNNVKYYKFNDKNEYVLMSDVSKFNIQFEHFKNTEDYEVFLLNSNINYVYIRLGGRGYGEKGNFYTDTKFQDYINACEYLGIPYGFYYLDEALNSEEIDEEVKFVEEFLKENKTKNCVLPLVIDIENHDGVGRADNSWEDRKFLVSELIDKLKLKNIDTLVYSNANIANQYLSEINTKFWLAYYNLEKKVPKYWYTSTDQEAVLNEELMKNMVAWQFTETGAGKEVNYPVDLSIVNNEYFKKFVNEK